MAGYIGTQAVSVNTTSATISDDLAVGDDALITGTLTTTAATVFNGGFASNADSTITIDDNGYNLTLISTDADENSGPRLKLQRNSANPAADDFIGLIDFTGQDAGGNETRYANIVTQIASPTAGGEGGKFIIEVASHDAGMETGFEIIDGNANGELDVNIGSGTSSVTTIAGTLTSTGTVGVRAAAASAVALTVKSTGNTASALVVQQTGNTDGWGFTPDNTNGNLDFVRIGGGAGTYFRLGVNGSITSVSGGSNNTRFGANAGALYQSGGNNNTVYGNEAGNDITSGDENAYFGYLAGDDSSTGGQNVAIGSQALSAGSSLGDNTCVGRSAGESLNNGSNTAIGTNALFAGSNTAGVVAVGSHAFKNHEVGSGALTGNVAVGYRAAFEVTTGVSNVYLGADCGFNNISGDSNVFIGFSSGSGASSAKLTGGENVGIGRNALVAIQADSNRNTCVGTYAGDTITTGDDAVCIGYNVDTSAASVGNQIIIGNSRAGAGANTARLGLSGGFATLDLNGSDTSWAASSDSRLKKDVTDCPAGLSFIKDLRPITFKWEAKDAVDNTLPQYDADSSDPVYGSGKTQHGFIAQEVKTAIDAHSELKDGFSMWREDPDGTQEVAPSALVPMLVKAIQELEARIAVLEG